VNLFQPKSSARENLLFLVFFVTTLKAVHEYNDLLRASIASDSNDYRLGANEAPPAIMSAFIGSTMSAVLDELEKNGNIKIEKGDNMYMKLGIDKIPPIILDNTDRNRTSPFAFTGNKFEFRAVGSSANVAGPMTVLNLIVADQLIAFKSKVDALMNKGTDKKLAIVEVLRDFIKSSKTVRFEGDGYSDAWAKEAERRGLNNRKNTVEAFKVFHEKKTIDLFERLNVMTNREVEARVEIQLEKYLKNVQIESRMIGDLAMNHIIPTATMYQNKLIDNAKGLKDLGLDNKAIIHTIEEVGRHIHAITGMVDEMIDVRRRINKIEDTEKRAAAYCHEVKEKFFDAIRYHVDKLELLVSDDDWPLAKYREMLFLR
jgi:glutamine synthetase